MPTVCTSGCGFNTAGGQLALDWKAIGVKTDFGTNGTDTWTLVQFVRLQYCNDTCRDQVLAVSAFCGYVNMNLDGINYWDFAVSAGFQLDTPPTSGTLDLNVAGRYRNSRTDSGLQRYSAPVHSADQAVLVPAGRCLHMIGQTFRNMYVSSGGGNNGLSYNRLELNYRGWPQSL
jgi:hypothetical protein